MNTEQIDQIMLANDGLYHPVIEETIRQRLVGSDEGTAQTAFAGLTGIRKMLVFSVLIGSLGVDRFMLEQKFLGVLKLFTAGGCFIWTIIDWFTTADRTRAYNTKKILSRLQEPLPQAVP